MADPRQNVTINEQRLAETRGLMSVNDAGKVTIATERPQRSVNQEIENLKRLLANVSQRLDALKSS